LQAGEFLIQIRINFVERHGVALRKLLAFARHGRRSRKIAALVDMLECGDTPYPERR
jgi:hypothetical protein